MNRGANKKACRLWYKLNENTKIIGLTSYTEAGALVGQGTIGGALVSQGVLDEGIKKHFVPGGGDETNYGAVPVAPLIFMDDVIHSAANVEGARLANQKMDNMVKQLNSSLNQDKTVCTVIGSLKQRNQIRQALEAQPLMCGQFETKLVEKFKWLGQMLSSRGLSDLAAETVAVREGKIRGACLEIALIVNDWRSRMVGGMETALLLWEACCIPSLLHGAGTWVDISETTIKKLNQIQFWFLRLALQVGQGAPRASLLWDNQVLYMQLRVWKEKILLVIHIRNLDENSIANQIYKEQKEKQFSGLALETKSICQSLNIEDCNATLLDKISYMKIVTNALHTKNEQMLRLLAQGKCERINSEEYGKKEYISSKDIASVRQQYRTRFGLQNFAGNYSNDNRFAKTNWLCRCLESRENEPHLTSGNCKVFGHLNERFGDLSDDENLVLFFKEVLATRDQMDENEE